MSEDILAEFQPLEETRKNILEDFDLLIKATKVWMNYAARFWVRGTSCFEADDWARFLSDPLPRGFSELTAILAWCCDGSQKYSIDPTPLTDLASWHDYFSLGAELGAACSALSGLGGGVVRVA
jgi:hypothetical protein